MEPKDGLAAHLLIATPAMQDPRFARAVIYLCAHTPDGAMGLVVNKPAPGVDFGDLLDQLGLKQGPGGRAIRVRFGGPVELGRGFVLHSTDYPGTGATMRIDADTAMSATTEILASIAEGTGPAEALFALGYAGWGPGQLDAEIADNAWLVAEARRDIVFDAADDSKWSRALASLGIDPLLLSPVQGRA
ncbi:MAG: YqgE/AlgH family protein [Rubellimicrobium sp.]|nr:YqgE/AlgH family protein [Rubellimicrobium sp.]